MTDVTAGRLPRTPLIEIDRGTVATVLAFIPLLSTGSAFGQPLVGAVAPEGISVLFGAAICRDIWFSRE